MEKHEECKRGNLLEYAQRRSEKKHEKLIMKKFGSVHTVGMNENYQD